MLGLEEKRYKYINMNILFPSANVMLSKLIYIEHARKGCILQKQKQSNI